MAAWLSGKKSQSSLHSHAVIARQIGGIISSHSVFCGQAHLCRCLRIFSSSTSAGTTLAFSRAAYVIFDGALSVLDRTSSFVCSPVSGGKGFINSFGHDIFQYFFLESCTSEALLLSILSTLLTEVFTELKQLKCCLRRQHW